MYGSYILGISHLREIGRARTCAAAAGGGPFFWRLAPFSTRRLQWSVSDLKLGKKMSRVSAVDRNRGGCEIGRPTDRPTDETDATDGIFCGYCTVFLKRESAGAR